MKRPCDIIKRLRENAGLDQTEVAKVLGISQQVYSTYERGQYDLPSRHLAALAHFYHVNVEYLLGVTDYKDEIDYLRRNYLGQITVGRLISDLLALDEEGRTAVIEYVSFLKAKRTK